MMQTNFKEFKIYQLTLEVLGLVDNYNDFRKWYN